MDNLGTPSPQTSDSTNPALDLVTPRPNVVFFSDRGLRSGWRLLIYVFLLLFLTFALNSAIRAFRHSPPSKGLPTPNAMLVQEILGFALVFGCALIMSRIERRSPGVYGLPLTEMFGRKFWLGMLVGLVEICVLIGFISAFGGYSFGSLALSPAGVVRWSVFHLLLFTFVGFFEEFTFRGYVQFTLGDGIGFWPAAILLSLGFGAVHLSNPGEGWVGAASVALYGLLLAFSLYRTGNLWYAVGLHASFDWGETFLFSVPNSGVVMEGHLSNAVLQHGRNWLTGGTVGPEGSVFAFLTLGLQFFVVMWLFPKRPATEGSSSATS